MILVNSIKAILRQYNREDNTSVFDDQNYKEITIKCIPYDVDNGTNFSEYTTKEAKGYYQLPRWVDVKSGDQIKLLGKYGNDEFLTILEVQDGWLFNRIENYIIAVK